MRTVAVINQKGGCGKTTTAINLSAVAAGDGKRVLLIDLDPQSHCAVGLAIPEAQIERHIGDLLMRDFSRPIALSEWVWQVRSGLDLIPSTMALAGLEAPGRGLSVLSDRDRRLEQLMGQVGSEYDLCVIDCPPSVGLLTFNALRAATNVVIPVETSFFALQGAEKQVQTVRTVRTRLARELPFALLPTMYDDRIRLSREILEQMRKRFPEFMAPRPIRYCVRLREASSFGQPIVEYDEEALSSNDYRSFYRWMMATLPAAVQALGYGEMIPNLEAARRMSLANRTEILGGRSTLGVSIPQDAGGSATTSASGTSEAIASKPASSLRPISSGAARDDRCEFGADYSGNNDETASASVGVRSGRGDGRFVEQSLEGLRDAPRPSSVPGARAAELAARARSLSSRHQVLRDRMRGSQDIDDAVRRYEGMGSSTVAAQARRLSGARQTPQGILFVYPGLSPSQKVSVVGDFNDWSATTNPMRYNDRLQVFEACVKVGPGRHEYQFFVDGHPAAHPSADAYIGDQTDVPVVIEVESIMR